MKRSRLTTEPKTPFSRPSNSESACSMIRSSAKIYERRFLVARVERFMEAWRPCDLILTSRVKVRYRAQMLLFERHGEYFPDTFVPLLYRPKDTRRQTIMVTIPGPRLNQQELVLNDFVAVPLKFMALTVHSSPGLTIADPRNSGSSIIPFSGRISPTWSAAVGSSYISSSG